MGDIQLYDVLECDALSSRTCVPSCRGIRCLHPLPSSDILKLETADSSENMVSMYQPMRLHIRDTVVSCYNLVILNSREDIRVCQFGQSLLHDHLVKVLFFRL